MTGGVHLYRRTWRRLWLRRCDACGKRSCVLASAAEDRAQWHAAAQW